MQTPIQVTFRDLPVDDGIERLVLQHAQKLEHYYERITSCRVTIARPHRRHKKGNLCDITIEIAVPGNDLVVSRTPADDVRNETWEVAARDAFHKARRLLEDYSRKQRQDVKTHAVPPRGRVIRILPMQECAFVETDDGRELYLHAHSILGSNLDDLEVGSEVTFVEERGEKGPQATSVRMVGRS
jgi:cold shock CspA family protein